MLSPKSPKAKRKIQTLSKASGRRPKKKKKKGLKQFLSGDIYFTTEELFFYCNIILWH